MVREACKCDASRIAEILVFVKRASYRSIFNDDKVSFGDIQVLPIALKYINDENSLNGNYVYDDGIVKGMLHLRETTNDSGCLALEIVELYVENAFHGQGVGGSLIAFSLEKAKALGAKTVFLWVLKKNIRARCFYEKQGFAFTDEEMCEEGTPELLMKYERVI